MDSLFFEENTSLYKRSTETHTRLHTRQTPFYASTNITGQCYSGHMYKREMKLLAEVYSAFMHFPLLV